MDFKIGALLVATAFLVSCNASKAPSVNTKLGVISGETIEAKFRGREYKVDRFSGIRYAKPPTGSLRFQKPVPFGAHASPLDATQFTSPCPQGEMMNISSPSLDEDCLSLNVYVPPADKDLPSGHAVMVFVHGGGFSIGGSSMYSGEVLSAFGEVILVTINYRLGLFGFANIGDSRAEGNMGLWDQRLAFQWVHDNIDAFGGDPARVTIFGESAGSMSVTMQGMYPPNKGLFRNMIAESGCPQMPYGMSKDNINSLTFIAEELGCSTDSKDTIMNCLQTAEVKAIIEIVEKASADPEKMIRLSVMPTIDGDFIKQLPLDLITESKQEPKEQITFFRSLGLINGVNSAEGAMWLIMLGASGPDQEDVVVSPDAMRNQYIAGALPMVYEGKTIHDALISVIAGEYTDWNDIHNARQVYAKYMGDLYFNVPGIELSLLHANSSNANSWMYSFAAIIDQHLLFTPSWISGANHADELAPVFGYHIPEAGAYVDLKTYTPPDWELDLSERMMTAWGQFAKNGEPGSDWPRMDVEAQKHIIFNKEDSIGHHLYAREMNFWRQIVPEVMDALEHAHSKSSPFSSKDGETCDADGNCG